MPCRRLRPGRRGARATTRSTCPSTPTCRWPWPTRRPWWRACTSTTTSAAVDPFVSLAAAAAVTDRILLGTGVALVAQHDPIVLAKQIATLDRLSGGRFVLGMGYGWNRDEAADHGVDFAQRRAVAREKVLCMQALWSEDEAEFQGVHVSLPLSFSWPKPVQQPRVRDPRRWGSGARAVRGHRRVRRRLDAHRRRRHRRRPRPPATRLRRRGRVIPTPSRWSPSAPSPTRASWSTTPRSAAPRWCCGSRRGPRPTCARPRRLRALSAQLTTTGPGPG